MLGVFRQRLVHPPDPAAQPRAQTWLALEEIRDPGNLGTIIRTADATGTAGILLVGTTCDPWSRECIRATMGSIFAVPLARIEHANFHKLLRAWPSQTVGTHLTATQDFRSTKIRAPALIVMGGEGPGLTDEAARACKTLVKIPMAGKLDSLNLAVATALMLYQVQSQNLDRLGVISSLMASARNARIDHNMLMERWVQPLIARKAFGMRAIICLAWRSLHNGEHWICHMPRR